MQTLTDFGKARQRLTPARKRFWKFRVPPTLKAALDESVAYAKEAHNRSVDTLAELMGLPDKWSLYKWIGETRMPARMIRPFEHACGIDLASRWFAASTGKLLIDVPTGSTSNADDLASLQADTAAAITALCAFYSGHQGADETRTAVLTAMQQLGWHQSNVQKHAQPELDFDE